MSLLVNIFKTEDRIPYEYRQMTLDEIKKDLINIDVEKITNPHIFNLISTVYPIKKYVEKIELVSDIDTGDLEIDDETHSYYANGIPTHNTINISNDYPIEEFSDLYIDLWKSGARGCTTYREGTMSAVLETKKEADKTKKQIAKEQKDFLNVWKGHDEDKVFEDVSLPEEYPSKGFVLKSEGKKFYLHVAFKDKDKTNPFAIFVHTNNRESDIVTYSVMDILEKLALNEGIPSELIEKNKQKCGGQNNINKLARTVSLLLRHNVKIALIVKAVDNIEEVPVSSFVYRLKKFLMNYITVLDTNGMECPECNEKVIFMEGCIRCSQCGWSRC